MDPLTILFVATSVPLQVALVYLLLRGPLSRYFPLFLYVATFLVTTSAEFYVLRRWGPDREHYYDVYWFSELGLDLLLVFLVMSMTARALEGSPLRASVIRIFPFVLVAMAAIPFLLFETNVYTTAWNNSVSQVLNFGAVVMTFMLWSALLVGRTRDRQLLTVAVGLGLIGAGAALTLGIRQFTAEDSVLRGIADISHRLLHVASLLIWCWAFYPRKSAAPRPAEASIPDR